MPVICTENNIYLVGRQEFSSVFQLPIVNGFQTTGGGSTDAFICKFNSLGFLEWSSYLGGDGLDFAHDIDCQWDDGDLIVAGRSDSFSGFPVQDDPGGYYRGISNLNSSGVLDSFVAEISSTGVLEWSTFFGSVGEGGDYNEIGGVSVDVTDQDRLFITGTSTGGDGEVETSPCSSK